LGGVRAWLNGQLLPRLHVPFLKYLHGRRLFGRLWPRGVPLL